MQDDNYFPIMGTLIYLKAVFIKLQGAHKLPGDFAKMQILIQILGNCDAGVHETKCNVTSAA